jgi:hypothetical protein
MCLRGGVRDILINVAGFRNEYAGNGHYGGYGPRIKGLLTKMGGAKSIMTNIPL